MQFYRLQNLEMLSIQYPSQSSTKNSFYLEDNIFINAYIFYRLGRITAFQFLEIYLCIINAVMKII